MIENTKYIQKFLKLLHDNLDTVYYISKMYWVFNIIFLKVTSQECFKWKKKKEKH